MNVYIIRKTEGEIQTVNRTVDGLALEAAGLDIVMVNGIEANKPAIEEALEKQAFADAEDSDGVSYKIERHFVGG